MVNRYKYSDKCPSVIDFEKYLKGIGDTVFFTDFKKHIHECNICDEAIQGFETTKVSDINNQLQRATKQFDAKVSKSKYSLFKIIGYAASIVVFIGVLSALHFMHNQTIINYQAINFDYSMLYEKQSPQGKKIMKKSTEQFIYINSCNQIAYNDQYLAPENLINILKTHKNTTLITVEVGISDFECANKIINTIKDNQSAPVLTIRELDVGEY